MSDRLDSAIREMAAALRAEIAADVRPTIAPRLLSIADTRAALGNLSRASVYALIARQELRTIHSGRRVFCTAQSVFDYIERQSNPSTRAA